jgi:hypothetical protein
VAARFRCERQVFEMKFRGVEGLGRFESPSLAILAWEEGAELGEE